MKKAIITGPTGSIGIALINKLISENAHISMAEGYMIVNYSKD